MTLASSKPCPRCSWRRRRSRPFRHPAPPRRPSPKSWGRGRRLWSTRNARRKRQCGSRWTP